MSTSFKIEKMAAKQLLNMVLSCRCQPNDFILKEIVDFYKSNEHKEVLDYDHIVKIADKRKEETAYHRLRDFCLESKNSLNKDVVISVEDVCRHFCTIYHWKLIEKHLDSDYENIVDISSWFIGHMLLPVTVNNESGKPIALYLCEDNKIEFRNIFFPKDISFNVNQRYCIHFAAIIAAVNEDQFHMINQQLEQIKLFKTFSKEIRHIDYAEFQRLGNYQKMCEQRFSKHFYHN